MNNQNHSRLNETSDLKRLSRWLDNEFTGPFGWKFGWDPLLGFIPGLGDLVTSMISFYILFRAAVLGCHPVVLTRMALNILVDNFFDAIPVLGNLFDFAWKSNAMNMQLIERSLSDPRATKRSSVGVLLFAVFLILGLATVTIALGIFFVTWLWGLIGPQLSETFALISR